MEYKKVNFCVWWKILCHLLSAILGFSPNSVKVATPLRLSFVYLLSANNFDKLFLASKFVNDKFKFVEMI